VSLLLSNNTSETSAFQQTRSQAWLKSGCWKAHESYAFQQNGNPENFESSRALATCGSMCWKGKQTHAFQQAKKPYTMYRVFLRRVGNGGKRFLKKDY
jgi:hypothetical protein